MSVEVRLVGHHAQVVHLFSAANRNCARCFLANIFFISSRPYHSLRCVALHSQIVVCFDLVTVTHFGYVIELLGTLLE